MKKDLTDKLMNFVSWVLLTPMMLTENSKHKPVRIVGILLTLLWTGTWLITAIPMLFIIIVALGVKIIQKA